MSDFSGGDVEPGRRDHLRLVEGNLPRPGRGRHARSRHDARRQRDGHFWPAFCPTGGTSCIRRGRATPSARAIYAGPLGSKDKTRILAAESNALYCRAPGICCFIAARRSMRRPSTRRHWRSRESRPASPMKSVSTRRWTRTFRGVRQRRARLLREQRGSTGTSARSRTSAEWHLAWASRTGQVLERPGPSGVYRGVEVSPDTKRIAVHRHEATGGDIWIIEPSGSETRLTFDASQHNASPVWSPDGRDIVYSSLRKRQVGPVPETVGRDRAPRSCLIESELPKAPMSWSPDGTRIVFWRAGPEDQERSLGVVAGRQEGGAARQHAVQRNAMRRSHPTASGSPTAPTWSATAGRFTSSRFLLARAIGRSPWPAATGRGGATTARSSTTIPSATLANPDSPGNPAFVGPMFAVTVNGAGASFEHAAPRPVVNMRALNYPHAGVDYHTYAVSPDGRGSSTTNSSSRSCAAAQSSGLDHPSGLMIATNWASGLKK